MKPALKKLLPSTWSRLELQRHVLLLLPLWLSLLLAVIVRTWLIIYTHGVIAGDEAIVGIQAEHILRGALPIYYYNQPYMGSLEAYFVALFSMISGPSVWTMRATALLISLVLIVLTWRIATVLAEAIHLPVAARQRFIWIASMASALPPLYDMVQTLRIMGGYVEAFVIMQWMLLAALRLVQRWQEGANNREMRLRWAGLGFLAGLGLWVDPLISYGLVTAAVWIGGCWLWRRHKQGQKLTKPGKDGVFKALWLAAAAIMATLMGGAPALYWGAQNQWQNIGYIINHGSTVPNDRLHTIAQVTGRYVACIVPRVLGGALPTEPDVTVAEPHLLTFGLIVTLGCCCIALGSTLTRGKQDTPLAILRRLTSLPLLFIVCTSIIYCVSSIAVVSLSSACGPVDPTGRYVVPLMIVLPILLAAVFTLPWLNSVEEDSRPMSENGLRADIGTRNTKGWIREAMHLGLNVIMLCYFCFQGYAYVTTSPGYTFQSTGCVTAPVDNDPIIKYMQHEHLRYGWATGWIGDPITFKTNGAITISEPFGRVASNVTLVTQADRPSILTIARQDDPNPPILRAMHAVLTTYRVARFPAAPGFEVLVITPLSHPVSPFGPDTTSVYEKLIEFGCG